MSSINTNVASMQALQSLQQTNQSLEETQNRISTGFKIGNAKDNAAIWSVAQVMRSDIGGFEAISEQLSLGESTVAVARNASETVSDLTDQIKERVVAAQGDNVDRDKIQADIDELVGQVQSVVDAAQFNGSNLLKDSTGAAQFDILSSLDRNSDQEVEASRISVDQQNLSTSADDSVVNNTTISQTTTAADTVSTDIDAGDLVTGGISEVQATIVGSDGTEIQVTVDTSSIDGSGGGGSIEGDISNALAAAVNAEKGSVATANTTAGQIGFATADAGDGETYTVEGITFRGDQVGLRSLDEIDVTDSGSAKHALASMEGFIQDGIDAAANFGQAQMRVETQMDFVGKLTDSLTAGVGSLVDADMTEESAKLNALQVQQQLGTQALSIANQAPQALLSLFR